MSVINRWLWLPVLVLGLVCVVFGTFLVVGGQTTKTETIDGFSRTQIKMDDGTYLTVNSAEDIELAADYMKDLKYQLEDAMGVTMEVLDQAQTFDSENRVPDAVKYGLYFKFNEGTDAGYYASYLPTIDAQLVFGSAKLVLGVSKFMQYTGIALLIIGVALILVSVMLLGFSRKLGSSETKLTKGLP